MNEELAIPAFMVPSWRTNEAVKKGVEQKLMLRTWGGLGDQICAEPTLRFALKTFKGCEISLASECPALFRHLDFKRVFDLKVEQPIWGDYLTFDTIVPPSHLLWEFMCHMITNCVDFPSLCAFRCQLPIADKSIFLVPAEKPEMINGDYISGYLLKDCVAVHPGRHWQSKTFPKDWWDNVLAEISADGLTPVIIGGDTDDNRGTVDVDTTGCLDLRGKLSIMQSVDFLQRVKVLITNDSAPLHMAASGNAWIGFIATVKHPDYITHWRGGKWAWRMENLGLGGIWDVLDYCPNKENIVTAENVGDELLRSWLPSPASVSKWAGEKLRLV